MNNKFDELAKGLAQSVTRRQAFKRFGVGLAGMVLACFGLADRVGAGTKRNGYCQVIFGIGGYSISGLCIDPNTCQAGQDPSCYKGKAPQDIVLMCPNPIFGSLNYVAANKTCSF
jgi:hypothetical protein